jgi:hypothetical protein
MSIEENCKCVDCLPSCTGKCECLEMIDIEKEFVK